MPIGPRSRRRRRRCRSTVGFVSFATTALRDIETRHIVEDEAREFLNPNMAYEMMSRLIFPNSVSNLIQLSNPVHYTLTFKYPRDAMLNDFGKHTVYARYDL